MSSVNILQAILVTVYVLLASRVSYYLGKGQPATLRYPRLWGPGNDVFDPFGIFFLIAITPIVEAMDLVTEGWHRIRALFETMTDK